MEDDNYNHIDESSEDLENSHLSSDKFEEYEENPCDNYIYVFTVFLIQSIMSFVCFYLYYIYELAFKDLIQYRIIQFSITGILIIFWFLIFYFSKSKFYSKHKRSSNYIVFILINIQKIIFELYVYIAIIGADPNQLIEEGTLDPSYVEDYYVDEMQFQQYEARAYWKFSMCILYLMLIFYYYFKKEKTTFRFLILLLFSLISLLIFFLLVFFTQKSSYHSFRIWYYFLFMIDEIIWVLIPIHVEYKFRNFFHLFQIDIDWKVNRIDYIRYNFYFFLLDLTSQIYYKFCRCCKTIIDNYSI